MSNNIETISQIIERITHGKSFQSQKYSYDSYPRPGINYDDKQRIEYERSGETRPPKKPVNLKGLADDLSNSPSIFRYFLDGSRHTYKIDDISYDKIVYPAIAGQIGVGCCRRDNKSISLESFTTEYVVSLPDVARCNSTTWSDLLNEINTSPLLKKFQIKFDKILPYSRSGADTESEYEKHGIAKIQDEMVRLETETVASLVRSGSLGPKDMLIKDGTIEYRDMASKKLANNYTNVIGLSKSFNPSKCILKNGKNNSEVIANLSVFERTPVYMYKSEHASSSEEKIYLGIWYVRIRSAKYTHNIFDGVLKIEKILRGEEIINGLDTDQVDNITASVINERNPVCYGSDERWANHIYPIYLTESYVKSRYLSDSLFEKLF